MRVAWFSPLLPARSDVANFTERLRPELSRRCHLRLLTEEDGGFCEPAAGKRYPTTLGSVPRDLLPSLKEVDAPIYNLGNNPRFSAHTWFLSQQKPGVVVLHDLKLHHLFAGIYRNRLADEPRYLALLERDYGPSGLQAGRLFWREKIFIEFMAQRFPMLAWAVRNALAVVVHTSSAHAQVQQQTGLPTWLNSLPYDVRAHAGSAAVIEPGRDIFSPQRPARIVIFGYLGINRRVTEFLHALAAMEERTCFEVNIYGELPGQYESEVRSVVERLGLPRQVSLHGFVSERVLEAGIARSDLAVNLRYPTMGEASGSLLRIWDHALPCLVTQVDAYAALPEAAVCFVRPEREREDIQRHLRDFLRRPEMFRRMGELGRRHLRAQHQPATYVERLLALCEQLPLLRSQHTRLRAAERTAALIAPWHGRAGTLRRENHYAARIAGTF